jgi:glycerol-3-phosphate dehydrogenase
VRYLEQGNIALVMEALKERGLLRQNAPHLVSNLAFVVPNYDWWEAPFYGLGLKIYNALAGKYGFGSSEILTREETLARLPTIKTDGLRGGVVYYDGQFDDARLLINLVATAAEQGATLVNYMRAGRDYERARRLRRRRRRRRRGDRTAVDRSRRAWSSTRPGPFADSVRRLAEPDVPALIAPSQGIHLVFHHSFLSAKSAIMVPHTSDGRVMFAIPWHGHTLVGTTDTPITTPTLEPRPLEEEIEFILETAARYTPHATDSRRRPECVRGHPPARQERRRQVDRGIVPRSHDSLRRFWTPDGDRRQVDDVPEHGEHAVDQAADFAGWPNGPVSRAR